MDYTSSGSIALESGGERDNTFVRAHLVFKIFSLEIKGEVKECFLR